MLSNCPLSAKYDNDCNANKAVYLKANYQGGKVNLGWSKYIADHGTSANRIISSINSKKQAQEFYEKHLYPALMAED
jgi:hypothetical protein